MDSRVRHALRGWRSDSVGSQYKFWVLFWVKEKLLKGLS